MKAYLTFARRKEDDVHMLGIDNPTNICDILFANLRSGQPIIPVLLNNKIIALYIIDVEGNLYQIIGDIDLLFELDELNDLSLKNLQKYNLIKYFVSQVFQCLSIQEAKHNSEKFELLEEKIFYNLLHIEIEIFKCEDQRGNGARTIGNGREKLFYVGKRRRVYGSRIGKTSQSDY